MDRSQSVTYFVSLSKKKKKAVQCTRGDNMRFFFRFGALFKIKYFFLFSIFIEWFEMIIA